MDAAEEIVAVVSPRSRGGVSLFDADLATSGTVERFNSEPGMSEAAGRELRRQGFRVLREGPVTITIAGPRALIERVFRLPADPGRPLLAAGGLAELIEGAVLPEPPQHCASARPPALDPAALSYPYLALPGEVAAALGADRAHAAGVTGAGVMVAMIDSFFRHPFYELHGYAVRRPLLGPGAGDPEVDTTGHGTGVAANLFAVAPGAVLQPVKVGADSAGAIDAAVAAGARLVTCSWGHDVDRPGARPAFIAPIAAAIARAVAGGVVVCVAAGNGAARCFPAGHPDVIACGGVMVERASGRLEASDHASSFVSALFAGRRVPDLCGLVGRDIGGRAPLLMLPVAPGSDLDAELSEPDRRGGPADGTGPDDGWAVFSGTSSAAPQVAGAAALALQLRPALTPSQVKELLTAHTRDVIGGTSGAGEAAEPGPDAATGAGLIDVASLVRFLRQAN